uniref:Uncharacterized protein n=1 Tax=Siphoviridae sp. ctnpt50 TaxID=2827941 RepID=A0A8S5SDZ2_9CAUD|nr:MAG TPA: hypothetical protein [Siphoviridae sp. ctnpt50]
MGFYSQNLLTKTVFCDILYSRQRTAKITLL